MRDSDWSRQFLLRSDWLLPSVATITTWMAAGYSSIVSRKPSKIAFFTKVYNWITSRLSVKFLKVVVWNRKESVARMHSTSDSVADRS